MRIFSIIYSIIYQFVFYAIPLVIPLFVTIIAATKPKLFWPLLIIISTGTAGFLIKGFTFVDEFLILSMLFGMFMYLSVRGGSMQSYRIKTIQRDDCDRLHRLMFLLMVYYMIIQSARGIIELESIRKFRWIVFYAILGILSLILSKRIYPVPSVRKLASVISITAIVYFGIYIGFGLIYDFVLGVGRYELQPGHSHPMLWGSTAYVMFPLTIVMPSVFLLLKDKKYIYRRVGWMTLLVSTFTAFFFDSRISLLTIIAFLVISMRILKLRKFIFLLFIFIIILRLFISLHWGMSKNLTLLVDELFGFIPSLRKAAHYEKFNRDADRIVQIIIAFESISDSWIHFLVGYGFRSSGYVLGPYYAHHMSIYKPWIDSSSYSENIGTEAFTNWVVETGMIGLILLIANFVLVAYQIFKQITNPLRGTILLSLFIMFIWLFVINIIDIMLFYLAIMPSGLMLQLSRYQTEDNKKNNQTRGALR